MHLNQIALPYVMSRPFTQRRPLLAKKGSRACISSHFVHHLAQQQPAQSMTISNHSDRSQSYLLEELFIARAPVKAATGNIPTTSSACSF